MSKVAGPAWSSPSIELEGHPPIETGITVEELQLASRNRGMPLEALRYDTTPPGLHYLLTHFDIPQMSSAYVLSVGDRSFSLEDIRNFPAARMPVTMECAGNGRALLHPRPVSTPWTDGAIGTAVWTGARLKDVLATIKIPASARYAIFTGADHGLEKGIEQDYERALTLEDALRNEVLLAYEMDDAPLPVQHGAPLRLIVPGWYGMASVKWLIRIRFSDEPFEGYQHSAYRMRTSSSESGEPVTRIAVRSLLVPPGFPDYMTRTRFVDAGVVDVRGRAWSGSGEVTQVEFGVDDAWSRATLDDPVGAFAWRGWHAKWNAATGAHVLACRATDETGAVQPKESPWNLGGFANNAVQRVRVVVR